MKLTFLGAAGTVTGSKTLVETGQARVLVDCGLFQGWKPLRLMNWEPFPFDPRTLDAVVLTHAHLDHSGALPLLVRQGFRGPVWASAATASLCGLLLPDSGRLQEEEAAYANRHHTSRHQPAQPLYTEDDARAALRLLQPLPWGVEQPLAPGLTATLHRAGHILGAAQVALSAHGRTVWFSGDLGRPDDALIPPPEPPGPADHVVIESTYGDRLHAGAGLDDPGLQDTELARVITRTAGRGGTVLIPAFAVGRSQLLLLWLHRLRQAGAIPELPVFLDSPMAVDSTALLHRHAADHRLSAQEASAMVRAARLVRSVEDSKALSALRHPAVIVSASGMATGGRVLHHLRRLLPDHRHTVVLAGYQAGGTRGARLAAGEKTLRIFGEDVPVRAEVVALAGLSAHADADQLMAWLRRAPRPPRRVFVTHGEPEAADALRLRIDRELGWPADVPRLGQCVDLADGPA